MDELNDFFNVSKPFKRVTISGGTTNGRTVKDEDDVKTIKREANNGIEYVGEYQKAEAKLLEKVCSLVHQFYHIFLPILCLCTGFSGRKK